MHHLEELKKLKTYEGKLKFVYFLIKDKQIGMATFAFLIESFMEEK